MSQKRPGEALTDMRYVRIRLASPSPENSESDTESIHSCQGYKTEIVNDTSDTSSPPPSDLRNIEFEVADVEENKFSYFFSDTEGEDFETFISVGNESVGDSFDDALMADTSEENPTSPTSNSDVDPGLPRNDYLDFEKCSLCKTDQKDISYPYCSGCFTWKKNCFPNRPRKSKKNRNILRDRKEERNENHETIKKGNLSDEFIDSGVGSSEGQQSEDVVDGPSTSASMPNLKSNESIHPDRVCKVCFAKRECGLFVHLNVAHLYGCYSCANRIWYRNGSCPICRRKVSKIVRLVL